ncbi:hypothetical protein [Vibrio sinaloensis]|uniref:hypothetical protein n=1 Tax=Photobacterium sp. (strain ATCC 43367) TaxID=379097 RepID=UPI0022B02BD1|nr:hypothetical protein [Vibrio sinaloensis]MCZ4293287.1 hypothetical protein [Vibrio sinaloensis]
MLKLVVKVAVINVIAAIVVWLLSYFVDFFVVTRLSDFLLMVVIVIWGLAGLTWEGGIDSKTARHNNPKLNSVYKMVKGFDVEKDERKRYRQNYQDGLLLFIAGIPALTGCIVLNIL